MHVVDRLLECKDLHFKMHNMVFTQLRSMIKCWTLDMNTTYCYQCFDARVNERNLGFDFIYKMYKIYQSITAHRKVQIKNIL